MVRLSDARMSGTAFGTVVLHISPEAAVGGPLALVRNGDMIRLDVAGAAHRRAGRRGGTRPGAPPRACAAVERPDARLCAALPRPRAAGRRRAATSISSSPRRPPISRRPRNECAFSARDRTPAMPAAQCAGAARRQPPSAGNLRHARPCLRAGRALPARPRPRLHAFAGHHYRLPPGHGRLWHRAGRAGAPERLRLRQQRAVRGAGDHAQETARRRGDLAQTPRNRCSPGRTVSACAACASIRATLPA